MTVTRCCSRVVLRHEFIASHGRLQFVPDKDAPSITTRARTPAPCIESHSVARDNHRALPNGAPVGGSPALSMIRGCQPARRYSFSKGFSVVRKRRKFIGSAEEP